tara:strand:- start:242 stop:652 length:411 start_codon:yes stop_codon:yes gene_type:complete
MGEDPLFSNVQENLMKKLLMALVTALMLPLSAVAIEIGNTGISVDNEIEAVWSVDNEDYDLTLESGVTVPVWIMSANVNADFDIEALIEDEGADTYKGLDIGIDYSLTSFMMLEVDTGVDNDWEMEDIKLSATFSF